MSALTPVNTAKWAAAYIEKYGFSVVPLPVRSKKPVKENWGNDVISDKDAAIAFFKKNTSANIGLALGPSRVCSWDVDNEEATRMICDEFGFNLDAMRDATPTIQGKKTGMRMMFRVPDGVHLPYHSLTWPNKDDPSGEKYRALMAEAKDLEAEGKKELCEAKRAEAKNFARFTVFELRAACDGQQRQDVLPPSIHPDTGQPYEWITLPKGSLPNPPDWLITIWKQWDKFKPQLQDVCPWAEKRSVELPPVRPTRESSGQPSVIDAYLSSTDLLTNLKQYGYKQTGKRWLSPHSSTKLPGVNIFPDGRAWIHHASDPLCSDESGKPVNAFDLFCYYEHNGDASKAVKAAAKLLGMKPEPRPRNIPTARPSESIDPDTGEITVSLPKDPANVALSPIEWQEILDGNKNGPFNNLDNVVRVIERDPQLSGHIWYDEFLDRIVTTWQGPQRDWRDADDVLLQLYMQRFIGLTKIGVNTCHDAALVAAFRNTRNECQEYLNSHVWDGVPRLGAMMAEAFGAEDNSYSEAVGRCWMISMVARVFRPGCKVDTVPVLEGAQGRGKSTALSIIGGKWFVECHENVMSKDLFGVLDGHMLVEIAEMHSFTRAEVERVKGIISCQVDRYRKSYGRNAEDHPRKTVLACTTNRDDWQRDETGARRFWPIHCSEINHDWLRTHRDQLFAEAVQLFRDGVSWWEVPEDHQKREVEKRRDADAWEPIIQEWLGNRTQIQSRYILSDCLGIDFSKHDQQAKNRVSKVMKALGWKQEIAKSGIHSVRTWKRV